LNIAPRSAIIVVTRVVMGRFAVFSRIHKRPLLIAVAAAFVFAAPAVLHAALPTEPDTSGPTSLAGQLLIAAPQMREPFDHAVILVVQHSRDGALGIAINHPAGSRPVATILQALGADSSGVSNDVLMFLGGPVSPQTAFVIHGADYRRPDTIDIDGRLAVSPAAGVLRDIGLGKGPSKSLVTFGYAGWAPDQLEDEIARGAWVSVPEKPALVFDDDRAKVWTDAMVLRKTGR
jgi:putative transcriptional regulator